MQLQAASEGIRHTKGGAGLQHRKHYIGAFRNVEQLTAYKRRVQRREGKFENRIIRTMVDYSEEDRRKAISNDNADSKHLEYDGCAAVGNKLAR